MIPSFHLFFCDIIQRNGSGNYVASKWQKSPILHRFASSVGKDYDLIAVHQDGSLG